jgi:cytochrome P450
MLQQLVDGLMFSGLLGTGQLTTQTVERIRSDPGDYVPMWDKGKEAFLLESARIDPPVTSVTAVLGEDRVMDVASGLSGPGSVKLTLEKGSTMQLIIASANTDPKVFGELLRCALEKILVPACLFLVYFSSSRPLSHSPSH